MNFSELTNDFLGWVRNNGFSLLITFVVFVAYLLLDRISTPKIEEGVDKSRFKDGSANKAINLARAITGLFGVLCLFLIWGLDISSVFIFATTTITLLGVALFANWSLLSNVTAYFILLSQPSFQRGNYIRIIDVDNSVEGYISELNLFSTKLLTENREIIVYPNNLLLVRPTVVNPKNRLAGIGKLPPNKEHP
ncbi:MAG: mechanosensitive ion channel domain-containing protein [Saprospiraceae bacterium]